MPPSTAHDEALRTVLASVRQLDTETVPLNACAGRILSADIITDMDMPPFDKSAMDGYALSSKDASPEFKVIETIPAGRMPTRPIGPGECSKIMTGAAVPEGADLVVRVEFTEEQDGLMRILQPEKHDNICMQGEDMLSGDLLVAAGGCITPAVVGVLAGAGYAEVPVFRKPRVAIIATGEEIVEPDLKPGPGTIRNSNSYQLWAQAEACGAVPLYMGIAGDTHDAIYTRFRQAMNQADVILLSGGVSMGDFDLVPGILREAGIELHFEKIAVKPGRPTVFGTSEGRWVFGLPGNPVSTLVVFELLVRPLLYGLAGHKYTPMEITAELAEPVRSKPSERIKFIPVTIGEDNRVYPVTYHGSAHLLAYTQAEALLAIPAGTSVLEKGARVNVRPL